MDVPREIVTKTMSMSPGGKEKDVIVYLAQFSNVHSSYGAQSDATSKNITGLSKFKRSLDLCKWAVKYLTVFYPLLTMFYMHLQ